MDHGAAIEITRGEMAESLETLGRMLGALGGGEIHVVRVVQLGLALWAAGGRGQELTNCVFR